MDPKTLAKSKRSHTLHHSKKSHHPNQKSKAPTPSPAASAQAGNPKNPSGKGKQEPRGKTHQRKGVASLPSNWDRYEDDEFEVGAEDPSPDGQISALSGVVLPRSKGADYGYLISEAQAQSSSNAACFEPFASLGDVLPDFNQGVGSMLSTRGQSILSSITDNNFIVDDRAAPSQEAPFLSLNLKTLAEQLAKVNLADRLFVEPDLLSSEFSESEPPERGITALEASSQRESEQRQTTRSAEEAVERLEPSFSGSDEGKSIDMEEGQFATNATVGPDPTPFCQSKPSDKMKDVLRHADATHPSKELEPKKDSRKNHVANKEKTFAFEASTAEAELDMLLDSLNDEKPLNPLGSDCLFINTITGAPPPQSSGPGTSLVKPSSVASTLDASIDDLLEETSSLLNQEGTSGSLQMRKPPFTLNTNPSLPSNSNMKSKVLDDFDSWLDTI